MERPGRSGGGMAIPARHERLINTVAPKAHFQAERMAFIFLRFRCSFFYAFKCSVTFVRDGERVSICMRVSDGGHKINRHGGAIFIHEDLYEDRAIGVRVVADIPQSPIAPIEIRDFVYGRLIEFSPATLYPGALIAGEKGLLARGLSESAFGDYGGLA